MDNNFNMQQNNMQQQMGKTVYMKPRRRTGWIAGLIVAAVMVLLFIGYFIWYKVAEDVELDGTWATEDGIEISFDETHNDHGSIIYEYAYVDETGTVREATCRRIDDKLTFYYEIWVEEESIFIYEECVIEIVKLTEEKLVVESDGCEYTLKRK